MPIGVSTCPLAGASGKIGIPDKSLHAMVSFLEDLSVPRGNVASVQIGSQYSGLSENPFRRYISDGRLTGYRLGARLLRIDLNELDQLFKPIPTAGSTDAA